MKIVIIGSGNVATHLSIALQNAGMQLLQVFSRSKASASALALQLNIPFTTEWNDIRQDAELYFYAVSDDALNDLIMRPLAPEALHVHTAGSININIFEPHKKRFGVLYPLQTLSKSKTVDFRKVPLFTEGSDDETRMIIQSLAFKLSDCCYELNSSQRMQMHMAAVFCCNFVNHLYAIAGDIVKDAGIPFDILKPLIAETADKVQTLTPKASQTGPAVRNDLITMEKHLLSLQSHPDYAALYRLISEMIKSKAENH